VNTPVFLIFGAYWVLDTVHKAEGLGAPIAVNAVAKDVVLAALAWTAAANLRRFAANVTVLILAHVAIVLGLVTVLVVDLASPSFTTQDTLWIPGLDDDKFSTPALAVWLAFALGTVASFALMQRSALRARFGLRYLWPTSYRTLVALAEALVKGGSGERVSPEQVARNVDGYLADLDSKGKKQMQVALLGLYLYPLPRRGVPLTAMSAHDRADFLERRFPETFATSGIRFLRMWIQAMIRVGQQLVFAGYYGDPSTFDSTGYIPYSVRNPNQEKRGDTGLKTLVLSQLTEHDPRLHADVVVIGSGAGGSIVAHELVAHGRQVLMLERGRHVEPNTFSESEVEQLSRLYSDGGLQLSRDFRLTLLQGMCVGGSTVVNNAVLFDLPDAIKDRWMGPGGLDTGLCREALDDAFEETKQLVGTFPQSDNHATRGARLFRDGADHLQKKYKRPFTVSAVDANIDDCLGCGYCNIGCAYGRKLSMLDKVLPDTQAMEGAGSLKLVAESFVERIEAANGRYRIVCRDRNDRFVAATGRQVVVAAGAIASSQILLRSGLTNDLIGRRLSFNVTTPLTAEFRDPDLCSYKGLQISHYLDRLADRGYLLETWFNPVLTQSLVMPGWFREHFRNMLAYSNMACGGVLVGAEAHGSVKELQYAGRPVKFKPSERDFDVLVAGMKELAEMYFAAGAKRVMPSSFDFQALTKKSSLNELNRYRTRNSDLYLASAHPQGGNVMCRNPDQGVVDERFRVHGTKNLYVCDASVFPSAVGVNPQLTVMAMAYYAARCIRDEDPHAPNCGCDGGPQAGELDLPASEPDEATRRTGTGRFRRAPSPADRERPLRS
jgi:choline dehydrogenase-like flavoprotein